MIIDYLLIGMKVREIRLSAKFTQEMLAKLSDSSPIYIYIYIYIYRTSKNSHSISSVPINGI